MLADAKPKNSNVVKAVQGVSFSVKKGECFILLGVNGAGKTTYIKMMGLNVILA